MFVQIGRVRVGSEGARALALRATGRAQEVVFHGVLADVPGCLTFVVNTHIRDSEATFRDFIPERAAAC